MILLGIKYNLCKDTRSLENKVCDIHRDNTVRIAELHKSLYEQRHAFHFSKVHDWLDYNEVGCAVSEIYSLILITSISRSKSIVNLVEWSFAIFEENATYNGVWLEALQGTGEGGGFHSHF